LLALELLQAVPIQNGGEIAQFVSGRDMQCLPNHPLLKFAVPDHDEGAKLYFDNEISQKF
jgi:hypothetical protein